MKSFSSMAAQVDTEGYLQLSPHTHERDAVSSKQGCNLETRVELTLGLSKVDLVVSLNNMLIKRGASTRGGWLLQVAQALWV